MNRARERLAAPVLPFIAVSYGYRGEPPHSRAGTLRGRQGRILAHPIEYGCQIPYICLQNAVKLSAHDQEVLKAGWFGGLPENLQTGIVSRSRTATYARDEVLIRQGDVARGMHALLTGRTHHLRQVGESEEVLLHVGEPGLWFGEYPLLSGERSIGSVVAAVPSRTLFLSAREFEALIDEHPGHLRHFSRLLAYRFAVAFRFLAESHGLRPEDWLLSRLEGILDIQRTGAKSVPAIDTISISQSQLANMVGLSRQTLSMLLARLAKRGLIEIAFRSIRVRGRSEFH